MDLKSKREYNFKTGESHNIRICKCVNCEAQLASSDYIHCCNHNVVFTKELCCFKCNNVPQTIYKNIYSLGDRMMIRVLGSCKQCDASLNYSMCGHCCKHKVTHGDNCVICSDVELSFHK